MLQPHATIVHGFVVCVSYGTAMARPEPWDTPVGPYTPCKLACDGEREKWAWWNGVVSAHISRFCRGGNVRPIQCRDCGGGFGPQAKGFVRTIIVDWLGNVGYVASLESMNKTFNCCVLWHSWIRYDLYASTLIYISFKNHFIFCTWTSHCRTVANAPHVHT
jgi:hypothetical protein